VRHFALPYRSIVICCCWLGTSFAQTAVGRAQVSSAGQPIAAAVGQAAPSVAAAPPVPAAPAAPAGQPAPAAPGETPVDLGAGDTQGGVTLPSFGEDPNRRLILNGFGVFAYDDNSGTGKSSFAPSAVALSLYKGISDHLSAFVQITTSRNPPSRFVSDEGASTDVATDIDNLQLRWVPWLDSGFDVTVGKFDSPLAIERDDAPLNFQATPSFTFSFARPVKFTGLQIHDALSPQLELFAIVANGWDNDVDNNQGKTGAVYGLWSPSLGAHVGLGYIYGAEKDNRGGDKRSAAVATLLIQPGETWVLGGETVAGQEPHSAPAGGTAEWYAQMLFVHHRWGRHWAGTLRLDWFDDRGGAMSGTTQVLRSLTVSPQYLIGGGFYGIFRYLDRTTLRLPEAALRLDLRYDKSTAPVFSSKAPGVGKDSTASATVQLVFLF
jgi:hypothetical protein